MSEYENVIGGKLRLKGKPLNIKTGGVNKNRKQKKKLYEQLFTGDKHPHSSGFVDLNSDNNLDDGNEAPPKYENRLTPAERRYLEQWQELEVKRLLKSASESHRDRVEKFNQYLANLSEHYDIPKVGPG